MLGLFAALALAAAPAPARKEAEPEDSADICLSIGHTWRGDNQDIRRIAGVPVPQSFRDAFYGNVCTRWQLREDSLIDWHLAFGTEASTTAALAFLEADLPRDAPAPAEFPAVAERAWQDAERALARAAPVLAGKDEAAKRAESRIYQSRTFRDLRELAGTHKYYVFLAQQYLRAAEFYRSRPLLRKAEAHLGPARDGIRILYRGVATNVRDKTQGPAAFLDLWDWEIVTTQDLEVRLAIAKGRLSGDPAEIDAAVRVLERGYRPLLDEAVDSLGDTSVLCDFEDDDDIEIKNEQLRAVREACTEERYFEWRVINFWRSRMHLDMLMAGDPIHYQLRSHSPVDHATDYVRNAAPAAVPADYRTYLHNLDQTVRLLENAHRHSPSGAMERRRGVGDDLIAIYLAHADMSAALADRPGLSWPQGFEEAALRSLASAERLARPTDVPGRFRQIAERYLAIHASMMARKREAPGEQEPNWPGEQRMHVYLRQVLDNLDRIAVGEMPPR